MRTLTSRVVRSSAASAVVLLAAYVCLAALMDPAGYLGTDTGAKVATLEAMDRSGTARPDVGYWAERWDPDGAVHPLYQARRLDDGSWVAVTTLPIIEAARPLYALGGYRATLLLPMLGGLACALAARRLARQLGDRSGDLAFWVVGLASPIVLYSLDFWEHSIGVAAVIWAVTFLVEAVHGRWRPGSGVAAGALLGLAATMRTEALVYTLVGVAVTCVLLLGTRRRVGPAVVLGGGAVVGFAAVWFANAALEDAVGGLSRASRASDTASATAGDVSGQVGERAREALVTTLGVKGTTNASWLIGLGVLGALALAWRSHRRGDRSLAVIGVTLAGLVYVVAALSDFGFVPGMVPAFPVIAGLLLVRPSRPALMVVLIATVALPLVWAFQYLGGAGPQWGGRYLLSSAVLLVTVSLVGLDRHPEARQALIALGAGVTVLGLVWMGVRTRSVHDAFDDLRSVEADVLIARDAFLLREGGPVVLDERWLTASGEDTFAQAAQVAARSGADTVAVVELGAPAPPPEVVPAGWEEIQRDSTELAGDRLGIVTYRLP